MRVVFNLLDASVGGGQRIAAGIAASLRDAGHEIAVATPAPGPALEWFPGCARLRVDLVSLRRPLGVRSAARAFAPYDLVYSHTSVPGAVLAGAAARRAGRPHVIHQHIHPDFSSLPPVRRAQRALYARAAQDALVIAVARHVAEAAVAAGAPRQSVVVVPNGVRVPDQPLPPGDETPVHVGLLARLDLQKGIDVYLDAASRMTSGARLSLGTPPPVDEWGQALHDRARKLGVEVVTPATGDFLDVLDVVAFPSRLEGHPLVLMEAMALGKPVVAAGIPGVADMFADRPEAAVLVPPGDAEALADALDELASSPERRRAIGAAGRALIEERYALPVVHARIIELLRARV
jgi:glycosyltransferase involved in cell wall biosynthesis